MQRLLPAVELFNTTKVANANARLNAQTHTNMKFHAGIPMMTLIRGGPHSMLLYFSSTLSFFCLSQNCRTALEMSIPQQQWTAGFWGHQNQGVAKNLSQHVNHPASCLVMYGLGLVRGHLSVSWFSVKALIISAEYKAFSRSHTNYDRRKAMACNTVRLIFTVSVA